MIRCPPEGWTLVQQGEDGFACRCGSLCVIASWGDGWDHVSVSRRDRCPTWEEMCFVRDGFFREHEWVVQYHPPRNDYVDRHPFCLHLWRSQLERFPVPPKELI